MRFYFLFGFVLIGLTILGQNRCVESGDIRTVAEVMPIPDVSLAELQYRLVSEYSPNDLGLSEGDVLTLSCIVNCRGESFGFHIEGIENDKLEKEIEGLYIDLIWAPAIDKDDTVDCLAGCAFKVTKGQFVMSMKSKGQGKRDRG